MLKINSSLWNPLLTGLAAEKVTAQQSKRRILERRKKMLNLHAPAIWQWRMGTLTEEMFQFESALGTVMPVCTLRAGHRLGWKYQRCMILAFRSPWFWSNVPAGRVATKFFILHVSLMKVWLGLLDVKPVTARAQMQWHRKHQDDASVLTAERHMMTWLITF